MRKRDYRQERSQAEANRTFAEIEPASLQHARDIDAIGRTNSSLSSPGGQLKTGGQCSAAATAGTPMGIIRGAASDD